MASLSESRYREQEVSDKINRRKIPKLKAETPADDPHYSDVKLTYDKKHTTWLEVKLTHSAQLGSTRVSWNGPLGRWEAGAGASGANPIKEYMLKLLNSGEGKTQADDFLKKLTKLMGKTNKSQIIVPTTKSQIRDPKSVTYEQLKEYQALYNTQYFVKLNNVELGSIVSEQYNSGKMEPVSYLQAADDFYLLGNLDQFKLKKIHRDIPKFEAKGTFNFRFSFREPDHYIELLPEIKAIPSSIPRSNYSCINRAKNFPFDGIDAALK